MRNINMRMKFKKFYVLHDFFQFSFQYKQMHTANRYLLTTKLPTYLEYMQN